MNYSANNGNGHSPDGKSKSGSNGSPDRLPKIISPNRNISKNNNLAEDEMPTNRYNEQSASFRRDKGDPVELFARNMSKEQIEMMNIIRGDKDENDEVVRDKIEDIVRKQLLKDQEA